MIDLQPMYAELYERALWTLVEIDNGVHGDFGRKHRRYIEDEVSHLARMAFPPRF